MVIYFNGKNDCVKFFDIDELGNGKAVCNNRCTQNIAKEVLVKCTKR